MDENKCTSLVQMLGTDAAIAPEIMERMKAGIVEALNGMRMAFTATAAATREMMATVMKAMRNLPGGIEWHNAYTWACEAHPKWVRIYHRTKKRRIAKKYRDRILRAYRAEKTKERERAGDT